MTVKELITELKKMDKDLEVVCFTEGHSYKALEVKVSDVYPEISDFVCEIGCGWVAIGEEYYS